MIALTPLLLLAACSRLSDEKEGTPAGDPVIDADGDGVDASEDCDDADAEVNPSSAEVCRNGVDDDCDGGAGDCVLREMSLASADAEYMGVADDLVSAVASGGDVDGDGFDDVVVGACGNGGFTGAAFLVLGSSAPRSASLSAAIRYTGEATWDEAGCSVAGAGDVDGDGFDDLVVGANSNQEGGYQAGAAYLVRGSASPGSTTLSAAVQLTGSRGDKAGDSVAGAGDVNADGFADLLVGGPNFMTGRADPGSAFLVLGSPTLSSLSLSTADAQFMETTGDSRGPAVAGAGDADGDGFDDMLVGEQGADGVTTDAGAAYLLLGGSAPTSRGLAEAEATYEGEEWLGGRAGYSVAGAGDVDADGYDDFLVGALGGGERSGTAYLLLGSRLPTSRSLGLADAQFDGAYCFDCAEIAVGGAGDVDADGHADVVVGAALVDVTGEDSGAAYLVLGSSTPVSLDLSAADARFGGELAGDWAGYSAAGGGDVNGDGFADLVVGAYGNDDGGTNAGAAYLVLGTGL